MRAGVAIGIVAAAALLLSRIGAVHAGENSAEEYTQDFSGDAPLEGSIESGDGMQQISQAGIEAIKRRESYSAVPYADAGGYSIGYGHFIRPGETFSTLSPEDGEQLLANDLAYESATVSRLVTVPLSQSQFDALVSLVYNIGTAAFKGSTLLKKLNAGDYAGAAAEFPRWNKSHVNGELQVVAALSDRRADEQAQFNA